MLKLGPLGRGQDPRPRRRTLLASSPAAARRQGAVRRPALRRNGSLGHRSLRRRVHAAGAPDRQVRRRPGPHQASTSRSSRATTPSQPARRSPSRCSIKEMQALGLDVNSAQARQERSAGSSSSNREGRRQGNGEEITHGFHRDPANSRSAARRRWVKSGAFASIRSASSPPRSNPQLVQRRGQEPGNDQLPHAQARARGLFCERIFGPTATGNAPAASTSGSSTRASSATAAASSDARACAASAWATSSWPCPSRTSGSTSACPRASASCST
jgi:hypothetical protein